MKLHLERIHSTDDTTLGRLWIDGQSTCFTLEDEFRVRKVRGETRIPAGTYEIKLRSEGGMIQKYRTRYGDWHTGMLHLQDVPGFEWIYIHTGNTDDHSEGCILVGQGCQVPNGGEPTIQSSRSAYEPIARAVHEAIGRGETVTIQIVDRDR